MINNRRQKVNIEEIFIYIGIHNIKYNHNSRKHEFMINKSDTEIEEIELKQLFNSLF